MLNSTHVYTPHFVYLLIWGNEYLGCFYLLAVWGFESNGTFPSSVRQDPKIKDAILVVIKD